MNKKDSKNKNVETLKHNKSMVNPMATNHGVKGCLVCRHKDRAKFERAWMLGEKTQVEISKEIGCSHTLVNRHMRNHLSGQSDKIREALDSGAVDVLEELTKLYRTCDGYMDNAQKAKDWQQAKAFLSEARQVLRVIAEVQGRIKSYNVEMNIYSNPQIMVLLEQIQIALEPWPEARLAVVKALETDADGSK